MSPNAGLGRDKGGAWHDCECSACQARRKAADPLAPAGAEDETDEAFVARVSADIITLDYDTSALEHYADLARCGAIARSPGPHAGGGEDIASEIATSLCSEKFLIDLCALKARTDFPKADEWGYDENITNNLGHVHGLIQEHVSKALSDRSTSQATQPASKRDAALQLVSQLDLILHDMCNEGSAQDRKHAEWAHGFIHDAAAHLSPEPEIRAMAEREAVAIEATRDEETIEITDEDVENAVDAAYEATIKEAERSIESIRTQWAEEAKTCTKSGSKAFYDGALRFARLSIEAIRALRTDRKPETQEERYQGGAHVTVPECVFGKDSVYPVPATIKSVEAEGRYVVHARGEDLWVTHGEITPGATENQPTPSEGWLPIESAPKDGETEVDLWADYRRWPNCHFHADEWLYWSYEGVDDEPRWRTVNNPTHWMPLPTPPGSLSRDGGV